MDLYQQSIDIILKYQSPTGAYVACPNFPTYRYCWFRDASFTAHAMDLAGHPESAARFHDWAAAVVLRRSAEIERCIERAAMDLPLDPGSLLHTRYTLTSEESGDKGWGNFQLDGFGTWLWALERHSLATRRPLKPKWLQAADLVANYLQALWRYPCYDCWEELPDKIHSHTLATIIGGLKAWAGLRAAGSGAAADDTVADDTASDDTARKIRDYLLEHALAPAGYFVKYIGTGMVDASLLGLAVPYKVLPLSDPRIRVTLQRIETNLARDGGVHRYAADSYYGGGAWLLLTAWLGWIYAEAGERGRAQECLDWVAQRVGPDGWLPEQSPENLNDPSAYRPWVDRWGSIATPLLWSHAMYIILAHRLAA